MSQFRKGDCILTKKISCRCQISKQYRKCNSTPCVLDHKESHVNVKFMNNIGNVMACHTLLSKESHVNVKFLNSIGNVMACHVSLTKEISVNVKFLNSIGNVAACHVSLTKEISNFRIV